MILLDARQRVLLNVATIGNPVRWFLALPELLRLGHKMMMGFADQRHNVSQELV